MGCQSSQRGQNHSNRCKEEQKNGSFFSFLRFYPTPFQLYRVFHGRFWKLISRPSKLRVAVLQNRVRKIRKLQSKLSLKIDTFFALYSNQQLQLYFFMLLAEGPFMVVRSMAKNPMNNTLLWAKSQIFHFKSFFPALCRISLYLVFTFISQPWDQF